MPSALFVISEQGYWGEECAVPFDRLRDAGFDLTVATPTGSDPGLDENSIDPDNDFAGAIDLVKEVDNEAEEMNNPVRLTDVDANDFDVVYFPGGHGTVWDINIDRDARRLLRDAVEGEDGKACVVCHASGLLAFTRDSDGNFLAAGRDVTGFPDEWEELIVDEHDIELHGRKLPYWVEQEALAAGANFDPEMDKDVSVKVDGDLITVRGPASSETGVETVLEELEAEQQAASD